MIQLDDLRQAKQPPGQGQQTTVGNHLLTAVAGRLPCNGLVWQCERCQLRGVDTDVFKREDCDA